MVLFPYSRVLCGFELLLSHFREYCGDSRVLGVLGLNKMSSKSTFYLNMNKTNFFWLIRWCFFQIQEYCVDLTFPWAVMMSIAVNREYWEYWEYCGKSCCPRPNSNDPKQHETIEKLKVDNFFKNGSGTFQGLYMASERKIWSAEYVKVHL